MVKVHSTAIVEDGAQVADDVEIGPYSIVGPNVKLAQGVKLISHVVIAGDTQIGENTTIYPFASLGYPPQDLKYDGEPVQLVIGTNAVIREYVTMHPGTGVGRKKTVIGDDCVFMVGSHVAHDCIVGNNVIFANNATLGGHISVGDYVMIGGLAAIHQHSRIGDHAFIGGVAAVANDVIPFGSVQGNHAHLAGLNIVGMKRRGFSRKQIHDLRNAYRLLFAWEGTFSERLEDVASQFQDNKEVTKVVCFIRASSSRSICLPKADTDQ